MKNSADTLVFEFESGETIPCSSEHVSVGILPSSASSKNLKEAIKLAFHHYHTYLERRVVRVKEFRDLLGELQEKYDMAA